MDRQAGMTPAERRANRLVALCFAGAALAGAGFSVAYWLDDSIRWEGAAIGVAFLLAAAGLIVWSHRLMPQGPYREDYPTLRSPAREEGEVLARLERGGIGRRRLLLGTAGAIGASLGAGAISTLRALGPSPYSFAHTPWRGGRYMVTTDGTPVHATGMPIGSVLTVFPEGFTSDPNAMALLIRIPAGLNHPRPGRATWAPEGYIAYSKVCSHAGCPVSLYNDATRQLQCPCHQSTFDVLQGARPVFGPAAGPLPQLPIAIDRTGRIRSTGDFSGPVGPVFWHHT